MQQSEEVVVVDVTGEVTEKQFKGSFTVKTCLTHKDRLTQDQIRRMLVGDARGNPNERTVWTSEMLSQLAVRVTDAPTWWTESMDRVLRVAGMLLSDDNVVIEVYNAVMAKDILVSKELKAQAEKAREDLKAATPPQG